VVDGSRYFWSVDDACERETHGHLMGISLLNVVGREGLVKRQSSCAVMERATCKSMLACWKRRRKLVSHKCLMSDV